ncbi:MAG: PKD domain-containing protein [Planctomycetota bacterium]
MTRFTLLLIILTISSARGETVGQPWMGESGITESIARIKARGAAIPPNAPAKPRHPRVHVTQRNESETGIHAATSMATVPAISNRSAPLIGTSFLAITRNESGALPPDTMGAVGPSQIFVCLNGRFRLFDRSGAIVPTLDVDSDVFFDSVRSNALTSDPRVHFDRESNRWFLSMITEASVNRVLIAVSSGPVITDTTSFTFFQFQHDFNTTTGQPDHNGFADYDTLGVDSNALYIGVSVFTSIVGFLKGATGFVVNKQALLNGTLTVTPFRQMSIFGNPGIYTPQGVNNTDPGATEGYFIGTDNVNNNRLVLMRISNPGTTPTLSAPINITVPSIGNGSLGAIPVLGSIRPVDDTDNRLFQAEIRNGSLYTAHNLEVDSNGVARGGGGRDGARWYEIINLASTPTLRQGGTLLDPANVNPRSYFFPTCAVNGQGHMALGSSVAGKAERLGAAFAMRLKDDALGTLQPPVTAVSSTSDYNPEPTKNTQRWGDYSATVVDPNDNMTFWTFQEYCPEQNVWGVQAIQIKAPPPARPLTCSPTAIPATASNVVITITGDISSGAGFYDPGTTFPQRLAATISGTDCVVNSVTFIDASHMQLTVSTSNAAPGGRTIAITNPDGQTVSSALGILCISPPGQPVTAQLNASGPLSAPVNAAFAFQVSGADLCGTTVPTYVGTVRFKSSDPGATLPTAYSYQMTDNGSRMFMATLQKIGDTTITVIDDANGLSTTFVVNVSTGPILNARPSARPNPGVVGGVVLFTASAFEIPAAQLSFSWDFGDNSPLANGATPAHVFMSPGVFNCIVTITDMSGDVAKVGVFVTITPPPSFVSPPTATPNPAGVGQNVQFNANATEPGADTLRYDWNFGDGSHANGASPKHIFTAAGTYSTMVTVSDERGGSTSATFPVTITVPAIGIGIDSDGDGFSDTFETATQTDPNDAHSTPLKGNPAGVPVPFVVKSLKTRLNFIASSLDTISLSGTLPIPNGFTVTGAKVIVDVSGVPRIFALTSRGKSTGGFTLNVKSSKGVVLAQDAKFSMSLTRGFFSTTLASSGLKNQTIKNKPVTLTASILFNGSFYQAQKAQLYTAVIGRFGSSK